MKLGTKLVMAFLAMAVLVGCVGFSSFLELKRVLEPLTFDIPQGLRKIESTSHLDALAQKIRHYDQILTESARDYVYTGGRQYKYRYKEFEPRLDAAIREAIEKGDEEDKKIFSAMQQAKLTFVNLEYQALASMDKGMKPEAMQILETADYWRSKGEYRRGLEDYIERRGKQYGESLQLTSSQVDGAVMNTHHLVENAIQRLWVISTLALILGICLGLYVSRSILAPIRALKQGAEVIGKGDLNHSIEILSRDEIGHLASAFNDMTRKLKESYAGLEDKVLEKTSELGHKVEEIEEQNKILEMSKAAMLNVLEDLEHAKSEVDEERAKDEAILASIGDGMIATDPQGKIIKANKQAEVMLGVKAADMLGKTFSVVMAHEDEDGNAVPPEQSPIPLSLARGKKVLAIAYFVRKDGTRFPAAITVSPIVRENKIMGAIEIFRDISKEKEIDRMKTEFISLASHELRTPLTVIREGVSLVIDEILGPTTAEQKSFLSMALKDIDRLGRIINNLLDVSKIEAGKMEMKRVHVNLSDIAAGVAEAFAQHAKSKKLELKTRFPKKPVEMYVDKDKIVQVFTNLVGNAMKFTEQGSVEISIEDGEDMIICSVRDTGRGISEQDMERVFRKFQQFGGAASSGEKGTGLGLSIAKGIVEMHHGRIGVESIPGQGTRFFFSLPKDTPQKLFQDQLTRELRAAMNERSALCVVSFTLRDLRFGESAGSAREKTAGALLEDVIRAVTHSQADQVLREGESVFAVFSGADKKEIEKIASKIRTEFASALENAGKKGAKAGLDFRIANYPEDGATGEELLSLLSAA